MAQESQGRLKHLASEMGIQFLYCVVTFLLVTIGLRAQWFGHRPNYTTASDLYYLLQTILIGITFLLGLNAISWLSSKEEKKPWPIFPVCFGLLGLAGPSVCAGKLSWTTIAIFSALGYALMSGVSLALQFKVPSFKKRLFFSIGMMSVMATLIFLATPKSTFPFGQDDAQKTTWLAENYGQPFKTIKAAVEDSLVLKALLDGPPKMSFPDDQYLHKYDHTLYGWFDLKGPKQTMSCSAQRRKNAQTLDCTQGKIFIELSNLKKNEHGHDDTIEAVYLHEGIDAKKAKAYFSHHLPIAQSLIAKAPWIKTWMGHTPDDIVLAKTTPFANTIENTIYTDLLHHQHNQPNKALNLITFKVTSRAAPKKHWFCQVGFAIKDTLKPTTPKSYTIRCYDPDTQRSEHRDQNETVIAMSQRATSKVKTLPAPWPWAKAKTKLLAIAKKETELHATEENIQLADARKELGGRTTYIHTPQSRRTPQEFIHRMYKDDATFFITVDHPTQRALCRVSVSRTDKPLRPLLEHKTICWTATQRMVFDHDNQLSEQSYKDRHIRKQLNPKKKTKPKKKINF